MKKLIVVKPGTLKPIDKTKLTKAGNIVIEHPDPHSGIVFRDSESSSDTYTHINCYKCGERIYLLTERLAALKKNEEWFYCSHGHTQCFKKQTEK